MGGEHFGPALGNKVALDRKDMFLLLIVVNIQKKIMSVSHYLLKG